MPSRVFAQDRPPRMGGVGGGGLPHPTGTPQTRKPRRWAEYLLAILAGNAIFLLLEPHLPAQLQHHIFRVDWGLGLDFGLCAGVYGLMRLLGFARSGGH